jgi:hypothetical protein
MMKFVTLALIPLLAVTAFGSPLPQQTAQQSFSSAAQATEMLFQAVQSGDEDRIAGILGGPTDLLSTDDQVQDDVDRGLFLKKYREMHRLARETDGSVTLYIGAENWPFPIPIVQKDGSWIFDAAKGRDEILFRTIGENELSAIATCLEFVTAERQYGANPNTLNVDASSSTSLVAKAAAGSRGDPILLYGYYFRLLPGRKPGNGFTLIAYPAQYRSSGVMTFVVNQRGIVYEKDLGPNTSAIASSMIAFQKDATWSATEQ